MDPDLRPSGSYSADAPIDDPKKDAFGRWPFAQRVAQVIAHRRDPSSIVVGIYGAWGDGKTTVLNFIDAELREHSGIVPLRFNPWRFGDEEQLLSGFFYDLARAVDRELTTSKEKLAGIVRQFGGPLASAFGQADTAEGVAKLLGSPDLKALHDRIEIALREEQKRVVVLVDDVDRLEKQEIQAVFRLVKLTADFKNTAYVLAFDDEVVAAALQERYGGGQPGAGRAFLEKIVQVPLHLPAVDPLVLRNFCFSGVDEALAESQTNLNEAQIKEFVRHFVDAFEVRLQTPRMAKLYGNILAFSLPILQGEVNPVDLMLVEGMRVFYPRLYVLIRKRPDIVLGEGFDRDTTGKQRQEAARKAIEDSLGELGPEERAAAQKLLVALFPRLNALYRNIVYGDDSEKSWAKAQRVASQEYFVRYFSYAVPMGDIPDQVIRGIVESSKRSTVENLVVDVMRVVNERNAARFIAKLRRFESALVPEASQTLGLTLAVTGILYPDPPAPFKPANPRSQAAILISKLMQSVSLVDDRLQFGLAVVAQAEPLTFALECFRWFPMFDEEHADPEAFSKEQTEVLGRELAQRIVRASSADVPLFRLYPDDFSGLAWVWSRFGQVGDAKTYVGSILKREPSCAIELLKCYLPTAWGMESGLPSKSDFRQSHFEAITRIVDPEILVSALQLHLGERFQIPERYIYVGDEAEIDVTVAKQFAWLHSQQIQGQSGIPEIDAGSEPIEEESI